MWSEGGRRDLPRFDYSLFDKTVSVDLCHRPPLLPSLLPLMTSESTILNTFDEKIVGVVVNNFTII